MRDLRELGASAGQGLMLPTLFDHANFATVDHARHIDFVTEGAGAQEGFAGRGVIVAAANHERIGATRCRSLT